MWGKDFVLMLRLRMSMFYKEIKITTEGMLVQETGLHRMGKDELLQEHCLWIFGVPNQLVSA